MVCLLFSNKFLVVVVDLFLFISNVLGFGQTFERRQGNKNGSNCDGESLFRKKDL